MDDSSTSPVGQTANGSYIAQASNNSSATVIQNNISFNLSINNIEQLNLLGALLPQGFLGHMTSNAASATMPQNDVATGLDLVVDHWERGQILYELNLNGDNDEIEAALKQWRVASSSRREPYAAIANGNIGIGHDDGVTFNLIPVDPVDNCSVECDLRIVNYGNDQSNWGGIRVRGFDFCPDFRLGYMVYLRQQKTVDLYGPYGVIKGDEQVVLDSADSWTNLRMDVFESQIQVYINGDLRISVVDKNFGNKGLIYLHTFRTHTQFRNFRVYELVRTNA